MNKPVTVQEAIEGALTNEWQSNKQVHAKIGQWAESTVRDRLFVLYRAGKAEMKKEPIPGGFKSLWRACQTTQPADNVPASSEPEPAPGSDATQPTDLPSGQEADSPNLRGAVEESSEGP